MSTNTAVNNFTCPVSWLAPFSHKISNADRLMSLCDFCWGPSSTLNFVTKRERGINALNVCLQSIKIRMDGNLIELWSARAIKNYLHFFVRTFYNLPTYSIRCPPRLLDGIKRCIYFLVCRESALFAPLWKSNFLRVLQSCVPVSGWSLIIKIWSDEKKKHLKLS